MPSEVAFDPRFQELYRAALSVVLSTKKNAESLVVEKEAYDALVRSIRTCDNELGLSGAI